MPPGAVGPVPPKDFRERYAWFEACDDKFMGHETSVFKPESEKAGRQAVGGLERIVMSTNQDVAGCRCC
jgi:hypothetical protein